MKLSFVPRYAVLALVAVSAACTMQKEQAPGLSGPSEFARAISVSITPDIITQDGASQSVVTISARGPGGEPLANVAMRAEILVNGQATDFGSLSARNLVTANDGRATLVYTAPAGPSGLTVDEFTIVDIAVTPIGTDFGNSVARLASLRLVPRGIIVPPAGMTPAFTATPNPAGETQAVVFDASTSTSSSNSPITGYAWDFGDGGSASGRVVSHAYNRAGNYVVTLTVSDALERVAQTSRTVSISATTAPTATFVFSPASPAPNTPVVFNGLASTAAAGRRIVSYSWDFGDPNNTAAGTGAQPSHVYTVPGNYTVTLTVTDDGGRMASANRSVPVQ